MIYTYGFRYVNDMACVTLKRNNSFRSDYRIKLKCNIILHTNNCNETRVGNDNVRSINLILRNILHSLIY